MTKSVTYVSDTVPVIRRNNEVPSQMVCRSAMYLIASHFPLTEKSDKRTVSGFENG